MAESIVTLRVEARNAISSLNKTSAATKQLSTNAKGATTSLTAASSAAKGLGASLAASLGPLLTVGAAVATVGNSIATFSSRARDVDILRQGLNNLGSGTAALEELQEAANKLGNETLFNQEEFTRGFNLLTSFRKIGVDSYSRVAQAAADIAQVNQVDVSTSFMQLAKALQDPERNLSNLNRSGIAFTKQQTKVIKELMKTNQVAKAHSMILDIVDESYNKLAQAAAGGFAGSVDSLGESFRDFSETLGQKLVPVLTPVIKGLTELLKVVNDFLSSPIGEFALIFAAIGGAAKGVSVVLPLVSVGLMKVAAAGGVATIALNAIPFVAITGLIAGVVTQLIKQRQEQDKVTEAIKKGEKAQLQALEADLGIKMAKEIATINNTNDKRTIAAAEKRLAILKEQMKPIKARLDAVIAENAELEKANKLEEERKKKLEESEKAAKELKKKFTEIGKEIEQGIKDNLREAITGAQSFGDAMTNVLNKIRDKIIDAQLDKLMSGFADNFGKGGANQGGKGFGGFLGGLIGGLFAEGGKPPVGKPSIVGEKGPELFVPRTAGTIIPNNQIGGSVVVNVNVDASGSAVSGSDQKGNQFGQELAIVIQQEIIRQKRSGGLLA